MYKCPWSLPQPYQARTYDYLYFINEETGGKKEIKLLVQRHTASAPELDSNLSNLTPELFKAMGLCGIYQETALRKTKPLRYSI